MNKRKYVIFDRFERSVWVKNHFLNELDHWGYTLVEDFDNEALAVLKIKNKTYFTFFLALGENEDNAKPAKQALKVLKLYASEYGNEVEAAILPLGIKGFSQCKDWNKLKVKSNLRITKFFYYGLFDLDGNRIIIEDLPIC